MAKGTAGMGLIPGDQGAPYWLWASCLSYMRGKYTFICHYYQVSLNPSLMQQLCVSHCCLQAGAGRGSLMKL